MYDFIVENSLTHKNKSNDLLLENWCLKDGIDRLKCVIENYYFSKTKTLQNGCVSFPLNETCQDKQFFSIKIYKTKSC